MSVGCPLCDEPLGTSRIECPGCGATYHVQCMAEIKSCKQPGCEGSLSEILRQRSMQIRGGDPGFTLGQRSVGLILIMGGLFASFAVVDEVTTGHTTAVLGLSVLVFLIFNPEIWSKLSGEKKDVV